MPPSTCPGRRRPGPSPETYAITRRGDVMPAAASTRYCRIPATPDCGRPSPRWPVRAWQQQAPGSTRPHARPFLQGPHPAGSRRSGLPPPPGPGVNLLPGLSPTAADALAARAPVHPAGRRPRRGLHPPGIQLRIRRAPRPGPVRPPADRRRRRPDPRPLQRREVQQAQVVSVLLVAGNAFVVVDAVAAAGQDEFAAVYLDGSRVVGGRRAPVNSPR
jgi:hypothetical protein